MQNAAYSLADIRVFVKEGRILNPRVLDAENELVFYFDLRARDSNETIQDCVLYSTTSDKPRIFKKWRTITKNLHNIGIKNWSVIKTIEPSENVNREL